MVKYLQSKIQIACQKMNSMKEIGDLCHPVNKELHSILSFDEFTKLCKYFLKKKKGNNWNFSWNKEYSFFFLNWDLYHDEVLTVAQDNNLTYEQLYQIKLHVQKYYELVNKEDLYDHNKDPNSFYNRSKRNEIKIEDK